MIRLYINKQHIDIDKSVGLFLTRTFDSTINPTLYHSDYSKTITLPMTANNRKVFEQFQRQDSIVTSQGIDPRVKVPYQLLYNLELVMEGFLRINNANTCFADNKFEVNLYGKFNSIVNDIQQYTFNKYECVSYGGTKPDEYLIDSPFQNIEVTSSLVKESFEQENHDIYGEDILDYIKFIPTYQGKYKDFESNLLQWHPVGLEQELTQERDEHYMREFRSYYQQPSIWVCKLWLMLKNKLEQMTNYKLELDPSWFNEHNPYWTDLLYTCPSLYNEDENFNPNSTVFEQDSLNYICNVSNQAALSNLHKKTLRFNPNINPNNQKMYRGGIFNPDSLGYTKFKMSSSIMICCHHNGPTQALSYCKLRKNNPLIVKVEAVKRSNGNVLASRNYTIYSHSTNYSIGEKIDVGTTYSAAPNIQGQYPTGYDITSGYWFEAPIDLELEIPENVPYIINFSFYFGNNGKPCELSYFQNTPHWDWLWTDWFYTTSDPRGVTIFNCVKSASCTTTNYRRSRSAVDMYRIFPKKTTLLQVILNYSKMFGLLWDIDIDNQKITVMTRNRFFTGSKFLDWSKKIDRSKEFKLEPLTFDKRYVNFNIEEGKGFKYEMYFDKYQVGYGSKKIDTEYQFNSDTYDLFKGIYPAIISQKAQFSRLYNTDNPDDEENQFMGYNFKIYPDEHYLENDNEGENAENSGAFVFFNGTMEPDPELGFRGTNGTIVLVTDDTEHMQHTGKFMWNQSFQNTEFCSKLPDISTIDRTGKYSVHFESPAEYYFDVNTSDTDYVYNLFWKNWIDERYSVQTKKLTCYAYLTPEDFKQIRFHNFVKIENTLYHINKVVDYDYDTNSPTKVELIQVWNLEAYSKGQSSWPSLSVFPNTIEVFQPEFIDVTVFSSDPNWMVVSKPSWVTYNKDLETLSLRATSDPLLTRNGVITLQTTTSPRLQTTLNVYQRPSNTWLEIDYTSRTVEADGSCFTLNVSSRPTAVNITSPGWIDVRLIPRNSLSNSGVKVCDFTAAVTVTTNYRHYSRTGTITIDNGNIQKTFVVTQLGKSFIFENIDDVPMSIPIGESGTWECNSNLEIDPDETGISGLGIVTKPPANKIGKVVVEFTPQLNQVDNGDGTPEVVSGGQITLKTKNGKYIVKNYNYGESASQYEIWVEQREGGYFSVDGRLYEVLDFVEITDEGTSYEIVAIPDDGFVFDSWSDGVTAIQRTVVVNSDIYIYPIFTNDDFETTEIAFDNFELMTYDNDESVLW